MKIKGGKYLLEDLLLARELFAVAVHRDGNRREEAPGREEKGYRVRNDLPYSPELAFILLEGLGIADV